MKKEPSTPYNTLTIKIFRQNRDHYTTNSTLKVQAIRSKGQNPRLYVYFPLPLAAAIGLEAGEEVEWELLDRGELHLVRPQVPKLRAHSSSTQR